MPSAGFALAVGLGTASLALVRGNLAEAMVSDTT